MRVPLPLLLVAVAVGGCVQDPVREFEIRVGWNEDGTAQYMLPSSIRVAQGDRVRFIVANDDDPERDYNGAKPGKDNFHDVALVDYDGNGDGIVEDIEHEVPAGTTTRTCLPQAGPTTRCPEGRDFFVATTVGTFKIICEVRSVPSHEDLGMRAAFIVG